MQLMEHSTDNPSVNMIPFPTRIIPDGEIIPTYATTTHPNLRYGNPSQPGNQGRQFHPHGFQPQQNYQARQPPPFTNSNVMGSSSNDDLREMMKTLASNTVTLQQNVMSFQQETRSNIHNLEKQIGQVASSVGKLEAQMNGKLPSQALNPKGNVSAIMLRSGKELEEKRLKQRRNILLLHKLKPRPTLQR